MHHIVYKITNTVDGKYYIGVHTTDDIEDGYMGSGILIRQAIRKHGASNFRREILEICTTREHAFLRESFYASLEIVKDPLCYNLMTGGRIGSRVRKEREIFSTEATSAIIPEKYRFNKDFKYVFKVDEKGMNSWRNHFENLKNRKRKEMHSDFYEKCTELLINEFPRLLDAMTNLYNNTKTNKPAIKLMFKMGAKNLNECFYLSEERWGDNPELGKTIDYSNA